MFVERKHRKEITERVSADGEIQTPLDGAEVREAVRSIVEDGMTSIAVCLLNSYRNPDHERRIRDIATEEADVSVTTSSAVMPEIREYERTLKRRLRDFGIDEPVYVMQANGGSSIPGRLPSGACSSSTPVPQRASSARDAPPGSLTARTSSPWTSAAPVRTPASSATAR